MPGLKFFRGTTFAGRWFAKRLSTIRTTGSKRSSCLRYWPGWFGMTGAWGGQRFSEFRSFADYLGLKRGKTYATIRQSTMKHSLKDQSAQARISLRSATGVRNGRAILPSLMALLGIALSALADAPSDRPHDAYGPLYRAGPHLDASQRHGPRKGLDSIRRWNQIAIDASGLDHTPPAPGETRIFKEQLGARSSKPGDGNRPHRDV